MAATRLRKTFRYPSNDSEYDDIPRDMDEEEQENLIKKLREENDERNEEYKRVLLAIPTVATTCYFPALLFSRLISAKLISLLSMSSLIATAYVVVFVPNTRSSELKGGRSEREHTRQAGPAYQYLGYLNGGLSLLIALNALSFKDKKGVHEGFWLLCFLPLVSFSITILARRLMLSVDIDELEKLKYRYKGA